jgi:hypothetical protein
MTSVLPEAAQTLGAPGLVFETWETSGLNRFVHPERSEGFAFPALSAQQPGFKLYCEF